MTDIVYGKYSFQGLTQSGQPLMVFPIASSSPMFYDPEISKTIVLFFSLKTFHLEDILQR